MKVLVTGGKGQLGSELKKISTKNNEIEWFFTDRKSFNLSILDNIYIFLDKLNPEIIVNCAAHTSVNCAEDDFETSNITNHKAVELIASWCINNNCKLIHISTDYVYDGKSKFPYVETDLPNPLNNYGKSKLLGDIACLKKNPTCIIIRTSWLYSSFGDNFVTNIINLMKSNDEIRVVNDQFGSPTYAGDLADTILNIILNNKWYPGIYNYTNSANISWFDFANEIKSICDFNTIIKPIPSKAYPQKAKRPKYSILDNSKIINTFKIEQVNYLISLNKCIKILYNES